MKIQKKEDIEFLRTAIKNLKKVSRKKKVDELIEGIDWVLNVVIKHYYNIKKECTKEELEKKIKYKIGKKEEKQEFLDIIKDYEPLKYNSNPPSKTKTKKIIKRLINFFDKEINSLEEKVNKKPPSTFSNLIKIFKKKR